MTRAHDDAKAPLAFEDRAGRQANRNRLGELVDVVDRQPIACELLALGRDREIFQALDLLGANIDSAFDAAHRARNLVTEPPQFAQIWPVDNDRDIRLDPSNQLIGAHLDRL